MMVWRKRGAYPVGTMVKCSVCRKWAPRQHCDVLCVDCCVEHEHESLLRLMEGWGPEDRVELLRRSWRRPVRVLEWRAEGWQVPTAEFEIDVEVPEVSGGDFWTAPEPDQTWGNGPDLGKMLRRLRRSFLEVRKNKKGEKKVRFKHHGAGCYKLMLPESETGLRKEIAYYIAKGKICPSALRLSNPFDRSEKPLPMPGQKGRLWL